MSNNILDLYTKDTKAWIPHETEGWMMATIHSISQTNEKFEMELVDAYQKSHIVCIKKEDLERVGSGSAGAGGSLLPPLCNPPIMEGIDDLTYLSYLHEPGILHTIRHRYLNQTIYTYSGIVLIALNPFTKMNLYSMDLALGYRGKGRQEMDPHIYMIAEEAYRSMLGNTTSGGSAGTTTGGSTVDTGSNHTQSTNQSIIVSGESGAGKTVSAKYIMRYFATVGNPLNNTNGGEVSEVENQVLMTNPIMEAFGNAKTIRNDNSSRFGKYIEIQFNSTNSNKGSTAGSTGSSGSASIVGARIRTYLLERSRVVYCEPGERNYHIFYQLCAGSPTAEKHQLFLDSYDKFRYLNQGVGFVDGVDDKEEFEGTIRALSTIGLSVQLQWSIFRILSGILQLGNISIIGSRDGSEIEEGDLYLDRCSSLLGLDKEEFKKWILKRRLRMRGEEILVELGEREARANRDSIGKYLYSSIFEWLVCRINQSLQSSKSSSTGSSESDSTAGSRFIGVLDIYGFEYFKKNSFEQFCINYANEKLQQQFLYHVFKLEQQLYLEEGIEWRMIEFEDNEQCLEMIEGRMGILELLDEESRVPGGSDGGFIQKLYGRFVGGERSGTVGSTVSRVSASTTGGTTGGTNTAGSEYFGKPRFSQNAFIVHHYALSVTYDTDGFLEKNKDTMPEEVLLLLGNSTFDFCRELFPLSTTTGTTTTQDSNTSSSNSNTLNSKKGTLNKPTLGNQFKNSLKSLMQTINHTQTSYIRCIKPNEDKRAFIFDQAYVLGQLRACGVLETIRISCLGYPSRFPILEFGGRYRLLLSNIKKEGNSGKEGSGSKSSSKKEGRELCEEILNHIIKDQEKYQVGHTRVFLRAGCVAYLEKCRDRRLYDSAVLIQKYFRGFIQYREYLRIKRSVLVLQSVVRGWLCRKRVEGMRRELWAVRVQRVVRGFLVRRRVGLYRRAIVGIQTYYRQYRAKLEYQQMKYNKSAVVIQAWFKSIHQRRKYIKYKKQVVMVQSVVRRHYAIKELKGLKREMRSVVHFQQKAGALEKKVFELGLALKGREEECKTLRERLGGSEKEVRSYRERVEKSEVMRKEMEERVKQVEGECLKERGEKERVVREYGEYKEEKEMVLKSRDVEIQKLKGEVELLKQQVLTYKESKVESEGGDRLSQLLVENQTLKEKLQKLVRGKLSSAGNGGGGSESSTPMSLHHSPPVSTVPLQGVTMAGQGVTATGQVVSDPPLVIKRPSVDSTQAVYDRQSSFMHKDRELKLFSSQFDTLKSPTNNNDKESLELLCDLKLDKEIHEQLIQHLNIPPTLPQDLRPRQEVLFPAHLIGLCIVQSWRYGLGDRVKSLLSLTIKGIHQGMKYEDLNHTVFWLSNLYELLCIIKTALEDREQSRHRRRLSEASDTERVVVRYKSDLESMLKDVLKEWMKYLRRQLSQMIVPAVVEYQGLPGFVDQQQQYGFFGRFMGQSSTVSVPVEKLILFLSKLNEAMMSYYLEDSLRRQIMVILLKMIGVQSFNHLLMRKHFCTWRRGMQIQYNLTRVEEWCLKNGLEEGSLHLEPLMQVSKLLQLNKSHVEDLDILFDVCFLLSPNQIYRLLGQYLQSEFEQPIPTEVLNKVKERCGEEDVMLVEGEDGVRVEGKEVEKVERWIPMYLENKFQVLKQVVMM